MPAVGPPIAPLHPADFERLQVLLQGAELPTSDLTPDHAPAFLAAVEHGALVGAVAVEAFGDAGLLRSLVVAPEARGTGLGGRLVAAVEARAGQRGIATIYLLTTTAEGFFRARGYETADRDAVPEALAAHPEFAALCPASAACLKKALG